MTCPHTTGKSFRTFSLLRSFFFAEEKQEMRTRTCKKNSTVLWHPIPRKRCCEWLVRYKGDSYAVLLSCFMISVVTGLCTAFLWQRPLHCLKGHRVYYLVEEGGLRAVILATFFFFSISRALAFFTYGVRKVTCPVFALPAVRILAIFWVCPSLLNCFLNSAEWKMLECVRIAFKDLLNRKLDWRRNSEHGGSVSFEPAF